MTWTALPMSSVLHETPDLMSADIAAVLESKPPCQASALQKLTFLLPGPLCPSVSEVLLHPGAPVVPVTARTDKPCHGGNVLPTVGPHLYLTI